MSIGSVMPSNHEVCQDRLIHFYQLINKLLVDRSVPFSFGFFFKIHLFSPVLGLCCCGLSLVVASRGHSSCGVKASSPLRSCGVRDLSSLTRDESTSPALEGGFLTTGPPGKSPILYFRLVSQCSDAILYSCISDMLSFSQNPQESLRTLATFRGRIQHSSLSYRPHFQLP